LDGVQMTEEEFNEKVPFPDEMFELED